MCNSFKGIWPSPLPNHCVHQLIWYFIPLFTRFQSPSQTVVYILSLGWIFPLAFFDACQSLNNLASTPLTFTSWSPLWRPAASAQLGRSVRYTNKPPTGTETPLEVDNKGSPFLGRGPGGFEKNTGESEHNNIYLYIHHQKKEKVGKSSTNFNKNFSWMNSWLHESDFPLRRPGVAVTLKPSFPRRANKVMNKLPATEAHCPIWTQ